VSGNAHQHGQQNRWKMTATWIMQTGYSESIFIFLHGHNTFLLHPLEKPQMLMLKKLYQLLKPHGP
jgi:hypothetical protein